MIIIQTQPESPDYYDIVLEAGADFSMTFALTDPEEEPVDLTGCTLKAQLREFPESNIVYDFTVTHNNEGGIVVMSMPRSSTELIGFTAGVYDVFLTGSSKDKVLWGKARIIPNVTR